MNYLLDSSNAAIASVTFMGSTLAGPKGNVSLDGLPLGKTAAGELAAKVIVVGSSTGGGVAETRTYSTGLTTTPNIIAAGKLGVTVLFSSDFVGTVGGIAFTGATAVSYSDSIIQPGDTLPAITVTCSAGSYSLVLAGVP